jgi:exopolysaccharide biosynthesis polyprenyl glycosylphosphotransferase
MSADEQSIGAGGSVGDGRWPAVAGSSHESHAGSSPDAYAGPSHESHAGSSPEAYTGPSRDTHPRSGHERGKRGRVLLARRLPDRRAVELGEANPAISVRRRERNYRVLLAVADMCAAAACVPLAMTAGTERLRLPYLIVFPLIVGVAKVAGLYDHDELVIRKSTLDELPRLFQLATLLALIVWVARHRLVTGSPTTTDLLWLWLSLFVSITCLRILARQVAGMVSQPERCVVLGGEAAFDRLGQKLAGDRHVELIARLSLRRATRDRARLEQFAREVSVDRVVIAPDETVTPPEILAAVRRAKAAGLRVSVLPGILESVEGSVVFDDLDGLLLLGVPRFGLTRSSAALKRSFDLVACIPILLAALPVMAIAAITIKLDTPGPVFFRQIRVGRGRERFWMFKLRTMIDGADALKADLADLNEACGDMFKIVDDPRITRAGRWLRKTSLDELPQLFNVLRGEMSLVGPRPLIAAEDELIAAADNRRSYLTPGMTGPWQIIGGPKRVPLTEMVKMDCLYVANWSLWNDLKILLRTIPVVVARRGQ